MVKTIRDLPLGAKIRHRGMVYDGKPIEWIKVTNDGHSDTGQTIFITHDLVSRKAFDAKEPKNSNSDRRGYGNNNYELSNIEQWLNSKDKNWYSARHSSDQAPTGDYVSQRPYLDEAGFLYNFTDEALNNIKDTTVVTAKHSVDGSGTKILKRKIFLMSRTEAGLGDEFSGRPEGKPFPYFTSDERRKASSYYWLRTPGADDAYGVRYVFSDGSLSWYFAYFGNYGVRPALSLSSSVLIYKQDTDGVYEIAFNTPPTISGKDEDLGDVSDEISKTYTVFDEDDDKLSIIERLNNTVIGVHNDVKSGTSKTLTIPKEDIYKLDIGKRNTISIEVSDGQEKTYRNWTFTRTNTAPIIQVLTDTELGNIIKPFETKIKVSDPEHDKVKLIYTINRIVLDENESYIRIPVHTTEMEDIELDSEISYTIDKEVWDKLLISDYELEIKAIDDQSGENKEIITFTRTEDEIEFITPAIVKDVQPKQFISLWLINGNPTNIKIEACNNGLDDKPSWEDVTAEATEATPYSFKNSTKTADKWAVMAKVSLDGKGGSK